LRGEGRVSGEARLLVFDHEGHEETRSKCLILASCFFVPFVVK